MTTRIHQISPFAGRWSARPTSLGHVFREFDQLLQPQGALAKNDGRIGFNPIDLYETADAVVLEMVVPGVKADDIDISIEGRKLVMRGNNEQVAPAGDRRYWLKDIAYGEFTKTVKVPSGVDAAAIDAKVEDGLLRITMPKVAEALSRKITVSGSVGAVDDDQPAVAEPKAVEAQENVG